MHAPGRLPTRGEVEAMAEKFVDGWCDQAWSSATKELTDAVMALFTVVAVADSPPDGRTLPPPTPPNPLFTRS